MVDLVARLRSRVDGVVFPDKLAAEAADEIERLREGWRACRESLWATRAENNKLIRKIKESEWEKSSTS